MALFRLLHFHFPSTANLSAHQVLSSPLHKPLQPNPFISRPSLSLKFAIKRINLYQFHAPLLTKAQPTTQTSELEETETVEEGEKEEKAEEEEGEVSKTRILAQNVPWNSTVDDLRPLFEKYGTVVDVEVSRYVKLEFSQMNFDFLCIF